jgi:hypothetical protein
MPVQGVAGLDALDVVAEGDESPVDIVVLFVHTPGRVVAHQDVHGRKALQHHGDLFLLVQVMADRLPTRRASSLIRIVFII